MDEDKVEVKISLQQVSTPLPKMKKKTSLTSNISTIKRKAITPADIPKKRAKN